METLRFEVTSHHGTTGIVVRGDVDASLAPALRLVVDAAIKAGGTALVIDLGELTELNDADGIEAIASCIQLAEVRGASLRLRAPDTRVRRSIEDAGLTSHLTTNITA